jgi:NitT/TauT family transport system ATP-binding protein
MGFAVRSVGRTFAGSGGEVAALTDVAFEVADRELVAIVGPSGCGKTTLLRILAGALEPSRGRVEFARPVAPGRLRCALVFQEHGLLPWRSVLDNVALGLELAGVPRREREAPARAFIDQLGLGRFAAAYPHELSAGMRQRVALARAFVTDPEILLLDEPFAALDAQTRRVLQEELMRIWRDHRKTVVLVTHDIEEALLLGDRVLLMSGRPGRILEDHRVPLPRPRRPGQVLAPEVADIRRHIWGALEREVKTSLGLEAAV